MNNQPTYQIIVDQKCFHPVKSWDDDSAVTIQKGELHRRIFNLPKEEYPSFNEVKEAVFRILELNEEDLLDFHIREIPTTFFDGEAVLVREIFFEFNETGSSEYSRIETQVTISE